MSNLLAELAGIEFASQYESVCVTACKIKKEDMSMSVDIVSDEFPCALPFARFRAAIRDRYGVSTIRFSVKYPDFKLTENNISDFYNNIKEYVCFKKSSMSKILMGSNATFKDNILTINLRFGTEEILLNENIDEIIKCFEKLELSPITISKHKKYNHLPNLYTYIYN